MAGPPTVSVAIVTRNHERFIAACIESFLAQDLPPVEVVVADDASSDGTVAIVQGLARRHKSIRLLTTPTNLGIPANVSRAIHACSGTYVAVIGGDDLAYPGKLRTQVERLEAEPRATLCHHDVEVFRTEPGTGQPRNRSFDPRRWRQARDLVRHGNFAAAPSIMMRRTAFPLEGLPPEVPRSCDWVMNLLVAEQGGIVYVPRVLGGYRRHGGSLTVSKATVHDELMTLGWIESAKPTYVCDARHHRAFLLAHAALRRRAQGEQGLARRLAIEALRQRKRWRLREWRGFVGVLLGLPYRG